MESNKSESSTKSLQKPKFIKVNDLKPGVHGYNIYLKVLTIEDNQDLKRSDGSTLPQVIALCGDETGVVRVRLLGDNAKPITTGKIIAIRNGRSEVYQEKMRLEVDKWGKVLPAPDVSIGEAKTSNNISEVLYVTRTIQINKDTKKQSKL